MTIVQPGMPRAEISDIAGDLRISIPAARNPLVMIFLSAWLFGWAFGWIKAFVELSTVQQVVRNPARDAYMVFWLTAWSIGGIFAASALAWRMAGREIITLGPSRLSIARRVFGIGRSREYDLTHIVRLRVAPESYNRFHRQGGLPFWGLGGGPIAFDYGATTIRFGAPVEEGEAATLVRRLTERRPSLGADPSP